MAPGVAPLVPIARRSRPMRRCANSTGPGDVSLISTAIAAIKGRPALNPASQSRHSAPADLLRDPTGVSCPGHSQGVCRLRCRVSTLRGARTAHVGCAPRRRTSVAMSEWAVYVLLREPLMNRNPLPAIRGQSAPASAWASQSPTQHDSRRRTQGPELAASHQRAVAVQMGRGAHGDAGSGRGVRRDPCAPSDLPGQANVWVDVPDRRGEPAPIRGDRSGRARSSTPMPGWNCCGPTSCWIRLCGTCVSTST